MSIITSIQPYFNLHILSLLINVINLVFYALIIAASVLSILKEVVNVIIINGFSGAACLLLIVNEVNCSQLTYNFFRFLVTFRGRGLLYLLLSFIIYQPSINFNVIMTYFGTSVGLCFLIISFVPHILPLNDIKNNYKLYLIYLDEIRDQTMESGYLSHATNIDTSLNRNDSTIRNVTRNPTKKHQEEQSTNNRQVGSRLLPIKGHATLAMEINELLSDYKYEDYESEQPNSSKNHQLQAEKDKISENKTSSINESSILNVSEDNSYNEESSQKSAKNFTLRKSPFSRKKLPIIPTDSPSSSP